MSRVGDCWDNAVVESVFATLTKELLVDGIFGSRARRAARCSSSSRSGIIGSADTHRSGTDRRCSTRKNF